MKKLLLAIFVFALLYPVSVSAHPGNTDSSGCHTCRTNCTEKWGLQYGEYHCHNPKPAPVVSEPVAPKIVPSTPKPVYATIKPTVRPTTKPTMEPTEIPTASPVPTETTVPSVEPVLGESISPTPTATTTPSTEIVTPLPSFRKFISNIMMNYVLKYSIFRSN